MNKDNNIKYIGPRGVEYPDEASCRRAWENYNTMHVHIGPNGEQYEHRRECEEAWEKYNNQNTTTRKGRR